MPIFSLVQSKSVVYSVMWSFAAYASEMMSHSSLHSEDKTSFMITDLQSAAEHIFLRFDVYNLSTSVTSACWL